MEAQIVLKVDFMTPDGAHSIPNMTAWGHIILLWDDTRQRWHVHGQHDHRFPGTGPLWLKFKRSPRNSENIVLLNKHGEEWAELVAFPVNPLAQSKGSLYVYNVNNPPFKLDAKGRWIGSWWVNQKATQNLALFDPNENWFQRTIHSCTQDTGFRFNTSSGWGGSAGAGVGAGFQRPTLVFQRKEPNDSRLWDLTITAAGVGLMTPGISGGGSTESFPSTALTEVRTGPGGRIPFPITDLSGGVLFFDGGAGVGVYVTGASVSVTTFLFLGAGYTGGIPALATVNAVLQIASASGSGGKSSGRLSAGVQGLVYGGHGTLKQR